MLAITFIAAQSPGNAAEAENNFMKGFASALHLEVDNATNPTDISALARHEKLYDKVLYSTSRFRISLSDHMKLFFNLQSPVKYYPGKEKNDKNCTIFGMDLFF